MTELLKIQQELNAPKSLRNEFGKFNYRSTESILLALKPLLSDTKCILKMSDEIINIGDRYYVKATVTLKNSEGKEEKAVGFARESDEKKGMDSMQITGTASSYARKNALSGLFAIDDNKDIDSMDNTKKETSKDEINKHADIIITAKKINNLEDLVKLYEKQTETVKKELKAIFVKRRLEIENNLNLSV